MTLAPDDINHGLRTKWDLPDSKSIANRLAVIRRLAGAALPKVDSHQPDDIRLMSELLQSKSENIDVHHAGTAARFGIAYLALKTDKTVILKGSKALCARPMGDLIAALRSLGAQFEEMEKPGHLPVRIHPSNLTGDSVSMDGRVSSQFISAICMIAPRLPKGLTIQLTSEITSRPYLEMTLSMMERCGIDVKVSDREIRIEHGEYQVDHSLLEKDFSSAHYAWAWSQLVQKPIELKGLKLPSLQGDAQFQLCEPMWDNSSEGLRTVVHSTESFPREVHFRDSPDLAPTYICLYAALGLTGRFTDLQTLNQKESKRLDVLVRELSRAGYSLHSNGSDELELMGGSYSPHTFPTYDDHRMAMSFALFGAIGKVEIENPEVVSKSFPGYWNMVFSVDP